MWNLMTVFQEVKNTSPLFNSEHLSKTGTQKDLFMARFSKRYSRFPLGHKIHSGQGIAKMYCSSSILFSGGEKDLPLPGMNGSMVFKFDNNL
jgi:hypothetical protein